MSDFITIASSVLPAGANVIGFRGAEAISRPYEIEIFFLLRGADVNDLDVADAIGARARLVLDRAQDALPPFHFAGLLAVVEVLQITVPDVIEAVIRDNGLSGDDYASLTWGSIPPRFDLSRFARPDEVRPDQVEQILVDAVEHVMTCNAP